MHQLDAFVTLACNSFTDEVITHEMFAKSKVFQLEKIAKNLHKKFAELELQVKPSTHPKVLEERRKAENEATKRIKEAEALCAKEVKQVSQTWEALINDQELKKVAEQLRTDETKANQMKNKMKKICL